ncbi:MAG: hypothetical protein KBG28_17555 [Kofleriaceae bacterium]|nr:hypothetical protein [Kofleriaceae bacterium]
MKTAHLVGSAWSCVDGSRRHVHYRCVGVTARQVTLRSLLAPIDEVALARATLADQAAWVPGWIRVVDPDAPC